MRPLRKTTSLFTPALTFALLAMLFIARPLFSFPPVSLDSSLSEKPLGLDLEILEDANGNLRIQDILSGKHAGRFLPSVDQYPGYGITGSVYWARFSVVNKAGRDFAWYCELAYPHMDSITLYRVDVKGEVVETRVSGDRLPFHEREVENENFVFRMVERKDGTSTCYFRFETEGAMNIFLTIWSPDQFFAGKNRRNIILGFYYGAMIVMLLYNLFIFFSTWDRGYLYYIIYCLTFILLQFSMNGLAFQYLWPDNIWWVKYNMPILVFICLALVIQFSRSFLSVQEYMPRLDKALNLMSILCIPVIPVLPFLSYTQMVFLSVAVTAFIAVVLLAVTLRILMLGNRSAIFYIITWAAFWIGTVIFLLKIYAIVPDNFVTRWMLQTSSLIQVVLLSLGLADRINYMRLELETLNVNLEKIVNDRTRELNTTLAVMEKKEKEVELEFELAGNIQQGILPGTPFYYEGIKIDAFYQSMGKVGGDFFDIFRMKGGYLGILIADASGHGMPAAFITALAKISFSEAIQTYLFPADIFREVNSSLIDTIKTDDFITAFFVVISPTFDVFYSNASHQKALLLRKRPQDIVEWDTNGLFMGALPIADSMYEEIQDSLDYGDRILLFTDGIVEAKNTEGETFDIGRLKRLFVESASMTLEETKDLIKSRWMEFIRGAKQSDDATFVIIEIDPAYRNLIDYREKGFKHLWQRRYSEAIGELKKALSINPKDEKSHLYIGECYLKSGNYFESLKHLHQFLKNNEVDANVWYHLAQAYYNLGDYTEAHKTSRRACQLRNNFIDAMIISGLSLKNLGDRKGAEKTWARILLIDSHNRTAAEEMNKIKNG